MTTPSTKIAESMPGATAGNEGELPVPVPEVAHTPTPWFDIPHPDWQGSPHRIDANPKVNWANYGGICYASPANAQFIVTAANSHQSLVDALKAAVANVQIPREPDKLSRWGMWLEQARAALVLAGETK